MPLLLPDLPNELLDGIIALLDRKEIKTIRVMCKRLSLVSSRHLFHTLYLSCHDPDLYLFELVADNALLISTVKELVIDDTTVSNTLLDRRFYQQMTSHQELWKNRKLPYFPDHDNQPWDQDGRAWSPVADNEFHNLLKRVYENHHRNRAMNADVAILRRTLPKMLSLQSLVLSNRTADDTPLEGAQSRYNSSAVVKMWRELGEARRERPPFPPRVDWWAPLQDDEFEGDEAFHADWLVDGFEGHISMNEHHQVEELDDDEADNDVAHSDAGSDAQGQAPTPDTLENHPVPHHPAIPLIGARALRRESRGLQVVIDVLSNRAVQSRLTSFRVDASLDTISDVQQPGLSMRLFDFVSPPFASRLAAGFSAANISKFDLVLSNGRDGSAGQAILDHGLVGSVLASMPRLTELSIEGHNLGIIGAIPDGVIFQQLKRASFFCGLVSRTEIQQFVRRHANTLKQLTIAYCSLDDLDPSWEDVVEDINLMQGTGRASLDSMSLVSAYSSVPFTGCGRNKTKSRPPSDEEVYSFSLGVDETLVLCPSEDLGHQTP